MPSPRSRDERLAEALRANLARRKAQARAAVSPPPAAEAAAPPVEAEREV